MSDLTLEHFGVWSPKNKWFRSATLDDLRSVLAGLSDSELKQLGGEGVLIETIRPHFNADGEWDWECVPAMGCPSNSRFLVVRLPEKEDEGG